MSQDYTYQKIAKWETINRVNVPIDEWGHYLNWNDIRGHQARDLTSPYGALEWAIGTGDDFICFDYAKLPDGKIVLHAVVNSESAGFIDRFHYGVSEFVDAPYKAKEISLQALEWAEQEGDRLHIKGWNQDPGYFYRCVNHYVYNGKEPKRIIKKWREKLWA